MPHVALGARGFRCTSTAGDARLKTPAKAMPHTAYRTTTPRYPPVGEPVCAPRTWERKPPLREPAAVARAPAIVYQANVPVRAEGETTSESAACSTARNGPTSLPLGLITPMVAATRSAAKLCVAANTKPAAAMRTAPTSRVRRLPNRSARVVRISETTVSPMRVSVSSKPVAAALSPSPVRYSTSTTASAPYAKSRKVRPASSSQPSAESRGFACMRGKLMPPASRSEGQAVDDLHLERPVYLPAERGE